jgi:hypothetical protein
MFFRKKAFKGRSYLQLVQNQREGRKVRQRVITTLGRCEDEATYETLDSILASGSRHAQTSVVLTAYDKGEAPVVGTLRIGPPLIFERLWRETGCREIIESMLGEREFAAPFERAIFVTVLHRLMDPGSDRQANQWREEYKIDGVDNLKLHHAYRAMEWLGDALPEKRTAVGKNHIPRCTKDLIEERLFARRADLFTGLDLMFFDTTSIYFEGEGGEELGRYGKSKDHRPDRKQMVVGAVIDNQGRPICCELWPGNTADLSSLVPVAERLKKRFGIARVCIVADAGMISEPTMQKLEEMNWQFILGCRMRQFKEVRENVLTDLKEPFQTVRYKGDSSKSLSPLEVKEVQVEGRRYILCYNADEALKERADRALILDSLREQLKQGAKSLVGNKGYKRYLASVGPGFVIDEKRIIEEEKYDGGYILRTNTDLPAGDIALKYKQLWMVEDIFRRMKSILATRPVWHRRDETIRGHVFCSFLALVLMKELQDRLASHGVQAEWMDVLRDLDRLQEVQIVQQDRVCYLRTSVEGVCGRVFQAVRVAMQPTMRFTDH